MDTTVDKTAADLEREPQATLLSRARRGDEDAFRALVEPHRGELRAYCYRMLGSVQDAEDAVQNAMLRAWRGLAYFEGRSTMRSWLYSIATNTALDSARHRSRRELPVGFGPAATEGAAVDPSVNDAIWLEPCPNSWLADGPAASPEAKYEQRESVELAFMIMLQRLPPLQRAVLILRDVMGFTAAETAAHLNASVAAVNSALQRARSSARQSVPGPSQQSELRRLGSTRVANLAVRYADAIETGDVETLLGMLTEDASWSMPPIPTWFRGHDALRAWLVRGPLPLGWRHHATTANGQLAVGGYLYDDDTGDFVPHVVDVLTLAGDKIASVTAFFAPDGQDPVGFFAAFGLPARAPASRLCPPVMPLAAPASRLPRGPRAPVTRRVRPGVARGRGAVGGAGRRWAGGAGPVGWAGRRSREDHRCRVRAAQRATCTAHGALSQTAQFCTAHRGVRKRKSPITDVHST